MASSSLGVIVATLISSSLQFLELGTTIDPYQRLHKAKPSFSCSRSDFSRIVWIALRRSPCYNILGFVNNYILVWLLSQDVAAPNLEDGPHSGQRLQHLKMRIPGASSFPRQAITHPSTATITTGSTSGTWTMATFRMATYQSIQLYPSKGSLFSRIGAPDRGKISPSQFLRAVSTAEVKGEGDVAGGGEGAGAEIAEFKG